MKGKLAEARLEIRRLKRKLAECEFRNSSLTGKLEPLRDESSGHIAVRYVAQLVDGEIMPQTHPGYDIVVKSSGKRLEVKYSPLGPHVGGRRTRQWAWNNILGPKKAKVYDHLILVGDLDDRWPILIAAIILLLLCFLIYPEEMLKSIYMLVA